MHDTGALKEAAEIAGVNGERNADYGTPLDNHERIAAIWSAVLGTRITADQVALCMIGLKLARESHKHKRDNLVDICGYVQCLDTFEVERQRRLAINGLA